jgi:Reverse transcriptase (RNA-dependent DNA polymerase)
VQWRDNTTEWIPLKDVKQSYPTQLAEYAMSHNLHQEPAFIWWINQFVRTYARIVAKATRVRNKYWQRTHKYGIEIPKTVEDALRIDKENGNTVWWDAIMEEMAAVRIAFRRHHSSVPPIAFTEIKCHFVFDVKLGENFRCKARYVADGSKTNPPAFMTFATGVSRESVRIILMIASLNGLLVLSADIQNAYLHAQCRERVYVRAGKEFGSDQGAIMIIDRALYGLKTSGAAFRALVAEQLWDMGYRSCRGDPDVWFRPAVTKDGYDVYEYVLMYVDDLFCVSPNPEHTMNELRQHFTFKKNEVKVPTMFLGASLLQKNLLTGGTCWAMSSEKYVNSAVDNVRNTLRTAGKVLPTRCVTPLPSNYRPEMDVSEELEDDDVTRYQEFIGILRWAIELGRVDLALEVSLLSSHLALPRVGHLDAVYHIFGYLAQHPKRSLYFDPTEVSVNEDLFPNHEWTEFYRDAIEALPDDLPPPRGRAVTIHCFVDADHASNRMTRKSQTGILIFLNKAPIIWYSKHQTTVESSTYGSESVALKTALELIIGLRLKLRWMGIPIDGPANVYCDNDAVVRATQFPTEQLHKKHNGIAFHYNRFTIASGAARVGRCDTKENLSDPLTKLMSAPAKNPLLDKYMY